MTAGTSPGSAGSQPGMTIWTLLPNGGHSSGPVARCAGTSGFAARPVALAPAPVLAPVLVPAPAGRKAVGAAAPHPAASSPATMTRPVLASLVVAGLVVARAGVARSVVSGLVLIFLAV